MFPCNYGAQWVKRIPGPTSPEFINTQRKVTELLCKDEPVPLPLHCARDAKMWQQWPAVRKSRFSSFTSLFNFILQRPGEKRGLQLQTSKMQIFSPLETSRTSKGLSSHSKLFRGRSSRGGKKQLAFGKSPRVQHRQEFCNCWCLDKVIYNNCGYANVSFTCILI